MVDKAKTLWITPLDDCDVCDKPFGPHPDLGESNIMADASLRGTWGNFCDDCIKSLDLKFGTGLGQKYELQEIGTDAEGNPQKGWVKVEG